MKISHISVPIPTSTPATKPVVFGLGRAPNMRLWLVVCLFLKRLEYHQNVYSDITAALLFACRKRVSTARPLS